MLALFTVFMVKQQRQDLLDTAVAHVLQLSDAIVRSTHFMMLQNQAYNVHRIIADVARDKNIDRIRIFNKKGMVTDSTYTGEVGLALDRKAEGCISCHQTEQARVSVGDGDRVRIFSAADGRRMVGTMQAIRNEPSCQTRWLPCGRVAAVGTRRGRHPLFAGRDRPEDPFQRDEDDRTLAHLRAAGRGLRRACSCIAWSTRLCAISKPGPRDSPPGIWNSRSRCAAATSLARWPAPSTP